ncbi:unnamed protein product [Schistosoma margrebowiei]|uniref:Uncharacterized protein n=1 Tax=Schistosoma margrebowiei TaxID=48269 RepID=A0A183MHR6_9TREM|nr:unnamed protein product [Schistosoma margrebowiei]
MVAGDQQLVHTPFVPSGYWGPCESLVWNRGFPTPLGELTVSTGLVKAPDLRFSSSRFRKQHPGHEKAVGMTSLVVVSVCNTNVHLTATNIKYCNSDSTESSIHDDHLSLSTIEIDSVESQSSSELNQIQNSCETTVSNQPTYQISHVIVPNMAFPNDSHIPDEISYKSEENMLSEHNYDRKPDVVLIDVDFSNDPLLCNDIFNKFHENISEKSNPDVISYITYHHNAFVSCGKLVQCEAQVLNELEFDYNSDDLISTAVYPYHKNTSNVHSKQCEQYILNEDT